MIDARDICKSFYAGEQKLDVLRNLNIKVEKGEFVAIMGPSGSGKSTLLQLLGGLDTPTEGKVTVNDISIGELSEKERTLFRRRNIGFIFQNYQLLPSMTVSENIAFPLDADKISNTEINIKVKQLIKAMGLDGKENIFPNLLSGGQQQRVAIARALSTTPRYLLADEPTGNLDRKKGTEILELLSQFHQEDHQSIVMVTHDIFAAGYADRIIMLKDGVIETEISREEEGKNEVMANFLAQLNA